MLRTGPGFAAFPKAARFHDFREMLDRCKDIDAVMRAQRSLVAIEHTLRQVVCVKG